MLIVFNDTSTTEIYPLSLHDALPIFGDRWYLARDPASREVFIHHLPNAASGGRSSHIEIGTFLSRDGRGPEHQELLRLDRKSTRLNSSHANISYAVFCLKKKTKHSVT